MKKIKKIINACQLCLKYPFLYPRNRFSDRHTVNLLYKPLCKLYNKSIEEISITGKLDKEGKHYLPFADFFDYRVRLNKENNKLSIIKGKQTIEHDITGLLWSADKFEVLGLDLTFALTGKPIIRVCVKTKDKTDTTNYGFRYESVRIFKNKFLYRIYNIVKWIDKEILDRICFIPTYTELDAMPNGWRKAFGLQMCEDIKQALLEAGGRKLLKSYRITQIKEKFGRLCWYDDYAPEKVFKEIIPKYEALSYETCINCGEPAEYVSKGWISPYCKNCVKDETKFVKITEENAWSKALGSYN